MSPKPERPSLAGLPLKKKGVLPEPSAAPEPAGQPRPAAPQELKADGKVPVMVRMLPADRKLIRQIALGMDTSVQALLEEAIHDIIRRHRGAMRL